MNPSVDLQALALAAIRLLRLQSDGGEHGNGVLPAKPWVLLAAAEDSRFVAAAASHDEFIEHNRSLRAAIDACRGGQVCVDCAALERGFARARLILCTAGGSADAPRDQVVSVSWSRLADRRLLHVYTGVEWVDVTTRTWRLDGVQIAAYALSANFDGCVIDPATTRPAMLTREQLERICALPITTGTDSI